MKNLILAFCILTLSCSEKKSERTYDNDFEKTSCQSSGDYASFGRGTKLLTVDSCEYIVWLGSHGEVGFAHRGRCKFCKLRK